MTVSCLSLVPQNSVTSLVYLKNVLWGTIWFLYLQSMSLGYWTVWYIYNTTQLKPHIFVIHFIHLILHQNTLYITCLVFPLFVTITFPITVFFNVFCLFFSFFLFICSFQFLSEIKKITFSYVFWIFFFLKTTGKMCNN